MENRANGKGIMGTESIESNWVPQEDDDEENPNGEGLDFKFKQVEEGDAEEEDEFYGDDEEPPKLVRTGPTFDPLDMEALEIYEARKDELGDQEFDFRKSIMLTFQTLAVVFGDVGTSPLYTFDVMFNNSPVRVKEDVLGALSLVLYTLILIPLVKYVLVVLWANDDGEGTLEVVLCDFDGFKITSYSFCALGLMVYAFSLYYIVTISGGTFALYSLICRNAKVSFLTNQVQADTRRSSFRLKVPSPELERSIKIREHFEASLTLKNLLLALVLFGTSMVIANGVVTPAMSVCLSIFHS